MDKLNTELLISAVEEQQNIWNVADENYKNRDAREKSLEVKVTKVQMYPLTISGSQ